MDCLSMFGGYRLDIGLVDRHGYLLVGWISTLIDWTDHSLLG